MQPLRLNTPEATTSPTTSPWLGSASAATPYSILDWCKTNKQRVWEQEKITFFELCIWHDQFNTLPLLLHGREMICRVVFFFLSLSSISSLRKSHWTVKLSSALFCCLVFQFLVTQQKKKHNRGWFEYMFCRVNMKGTWRHAYFNEIKMYHFRQFCFRILQDLCYRWPSSSKG